jgi:hypothetical protein
MAVRLHRFVLAFATLCAFGASAAASAKDITAQVQADGDLGQRLAAVCRTYCLGNRARANLNQVTVVRTGPNAYWVSGRAALVNHQTVEPTVVFGAQVGGFDLFFYTVTVDAAGTLDGPTCNLKVEQVQVIDDRLGLTDVARREVGKVYVVPNCQRFLAGL